MNKKLSLFVLCSLLIGSATMQTLCIESESAQTDQDLFTGSTEAMLKHALRLLYPEREEDVPFVYTDLLACNDNTLKSAEQCFLGIVVIKFLRKSFKEKCILQANKPKSTDSLLNNAILKNLTKFQRQAELGQFK